MTFSVAYNRLGNLARDLGQIESAQACFNKSHAIREHLAQSEPGPASLQRDLYVPHVYLGDLARHLGDAESARTYFQESLAIAARLAQADPNRADLQRDLAVVYDNLGDLARDLNQIEPAKGYLQISLAILERLATTEPNRADLQRDLAVAYKSLGKVASDLGQNESAQTHFRKSLAITERLKQNGRMLPTDEPHLTKLRDLVQKSKTSTASACSFISVHQCLSVAIFRSPPNKKYYLPSFQILAPKKPTTSFARILLCTRKGIPRSPQHAQRRGNSKCKPLSKNFTTQTAPRIAQPRPISAPLPFSLPVHSPKRHATKIHLAQKGKNLPPSPKKSPGFSPRPALYL